MTHPHPDHAAAQRLAAFVCHGAATGLTDSLLHQAKRLLLNQLSASAEAAAQPEGQALLASAGTPRGQADIWWSQARSSPETACALYQQLRQLQPHSATHLGSLHPLNLAWLPSLMAAAQAGGHSGTALLQALSVGVEVQLAAAIAAAHRPPGRPHALPQTPPRALALPLPLPQALAGPAPSGPGLSCLGAAAARCHLQQLSLTATTQALWRASGQAPSLLQDAGACLPGAGQAWQLQALVLHAWPAPLQALAPIEAALALRAQAGQRHLLGLALALSPRAWQAAMAATPSLPAQSTPAMPAADLRHCVAASWRFAQFTQEAWRPEVWADAPTQALRARITLQPDTTLHGVDQCALTAHYADGKQAQHKVTHLLGSPSEPLRDAQLAEQFRQAAEDVVLPQRAGEILYALWALELAPDVGQLLSLLRRPR